MAAELAGVKLIDRVVLGVVALNVDIERRLNFVFRGEGDLQVGLIVLQRTQLDRLTGRRCHRHPPLRALRQADRSQGKNKFRLSRRPVEIVIGGDVSRQSAGSRCRWDRRLSGW